MAGEDKFLLVDYDEPPYCIKVNINYIYIFIILVLNNNLNIYVYIISLVLKILQNIYYNN